MKTLQEHASLWIFLGTSFVLLVGLGGREFTGFDCRFALFAREMFENGPGLFPTAYGEPYPDYPVSQTFLIYLASLLLGKVTVFSGVLPTALAAAVTVALTYRIGETRSRAWGLCGALLLLLTYFFFKTGRTLSADHYVTAATTLCFYLAFSAERRNRPALLRWIPLVLFAGFAFRGPLGLVIPAGVLCSFYLLERDAGKFLAAGAVSAGVLALGLGLLVTAAYIEGGESFVMQVWHGQVGGRLGGKAPWYFYLRDSLWKYAIPYPFAAIVAGFAVFGAVRRRPSSDRFLLVLVCWMGVIVLLMSIPGEKKARYIMPASPAFALLAAYLFAGRPPSRLLDYAGSLLLAVCAAAPFLSLGLLPASLPALRRHGIDLGWNPLIAGLDLLAVSIFTALILRRVHERQRRSLAIVAAAFFTVASVQILMVEPTRAQLDRTASFAHRVESFVGPENPLVFYRMGPDGLDIRFAVNLRRLVKPGFVKNPSALLNYGDQAVFVVRRGDFEALPAQVREQALVLVRGKVGRSDCVSFKIMKKQG